MPHTISVLEDETAGTLLPRHLREVKMLANFLFWLINGLLWLFLTPEGRNVFWAAWVLVLIVLIYVSVRLHGSKGGGDVV